MLTRQLMAMTTTTETRATAVVVIGVALSVVSTGSSELMFLQPLTLCKFPLVLSLHQLLIITIMHIYLLSKTGWHTET